MAARFKVACNEYLLGGGRDNSGKGLADVVERVLGMSCMVIGSSQGDVVTEGEVA